MQERRIPHLHVAHILGGLVEDELVRHALERGGGLQDRERDFVLLEVFLETFRVPHQHCLGEPVGRIGGQTDTLRACQLEHGRGPQRAIQMHMQLGLGPTAQRVFAEARPALAASGDDHAIDGARFADGVAGVDRTAGRVGHVGRAVEQPRQAVIRLRDRVAYTRAVGDVDCLVVDENPHQRSVRWKRSSFGASTGDRSTPR